MAELPKYRPLGVSIASIPTVDFAATGAAQARAYSAVSEGLDAMSSHMFRREEAQAKAAGSDVGAAQSEETLARLRDKNFGEMTVYDQAAYLSATDAAASKIEIQARRTMGEIVMNAEIGNLSPQQLQAELDNAAIGFSDSMSSLNPASSNKLYATLTTVKDAEFLNYSKGFLKRQIVEDQAQGLEGLDMISRNIESVARSGVSNFESFLDDETANLAVYLTHQQFSPDDVSRQTISFKERAYKARLRGMFDDAETVVQKSNFINGLQKDLESGGELTSGLDDSVVKTLVSEFSAAYTSQQKAVGTNVSALMSDVKSQVASQVKAGAVPPPGVIAGLRSRAELLAMDGGDVSEIIDVLDNAEQDADFIKTLNDLPEDELRAMRDNLAAKQYEGITQSELVRLSATKQILSEIETQSSDVKKILAPISISLKKEMSDLQTVINDFRPIPENAFTQMDKAVLLLREAGSDEADSLSFEIQQLKDRASFYEELRSQTPDNLQSVRAGMIKMAETTGVTPEFNRNLNAINSYISQQRSALDNDGVDWGKRTGSISSDNIVAQATSLAGDRKSRIDLYKKRSMQSTLFAAKMNRPIMLLDANEAAGLANVLTQSSVENRIALIAELQEGFGVDSRDLFSQISKDAPEIAHVAGLVNIGTNMKTAKDALRGLDLIREGVRLKASGEHVDKTERVRAAIGNVARSPKTMSGILSTADAIYAARSGGEGMFNASMYDTALQEAAGMVVASNGKRFGGIVEFGGNGIVIPRNIAQSSSYLGVEVDLPEVIEGITEAGLMAAGGGYLPQTQAGPVNIEKLIENIVLVQSDDGSVVVRYKRDDMIFDLTNEAGEEYSVDLQILAQSVIDARAK